MGVFNSSLWKTEGGIMNRPEIKIFIKRDNYYVTCLTGEKKTLEYLIAELVALGYKFTPPRNWWRAPISSKITTGIYVDNNSREISAVSEETIKYIKESIKDREIDVASLHKYLNKERRELFSSSIFVERVFVQIKSRDDETKWKNFFKYFFPSCFVFEILDEDLMIDIKAYKKGRAYTNKSILIDEEGYGYISLRTASYANIKEIDDFEEFRKTSCYHFVVNKRKELIREKYKYYERGW